MLVIFAIFSTFSLIIFIYSTYKKRNEKEYINYFGIISTLLSTVVSIWLTVIPSEQVSVLFPNVEEIISERDKYKNSYETTKHELENEQEKKKAAIYSSNVIREGLDIGEFVDSVAVVDNRIYYDENIVKKITDNIISFNQEENKVYFGSTAQDKITKVKFTDVSHILYDGEKYTKYTRNDNETFTVAGNIYGEGFTIYSDWDPGYILINLNKKYSKIEFDVGRVDSEHKGDAILNVSFESELQTNLSRKLSAYESSKHVEIDVSNVSILKIIIDESQYTNYGFYNIILTNK